MTAVQCTEPPSSDANQTRQLLLNDGRQFVLTTAAANNADGATSPSVVAASHTVPHMQVTANAGSRPADDELHNDLALRDEAQVAVAAAAVPADSNILPCPFCQRSDFTTNMELTLHVNSSHPELEDVAS